MFHRQTLGGVVGLRDGDEAKHSACLAKRGLVRNGQCSSQRIYAKFAKAADERQVAHGHSKYIHRKIQ